MGELPEVWASYLRVPAVGVGEVMAGLLGWRHVLLYKVMALGAPPVGLTVHLWEEGRVEEVRGEGEERIRIKMIQIKAIKMMDLTRFRCGSLSGGAGADRADTGQEEGHDRGEGAREEGSGGEISQNIYHYPFLQLF